MNLLARIKAAFSSDKFIQSSMHIMHGGSGEGGKRQAFSPTVAVNAYRSWIYAAANLNAVAVASSPLRLYVKRRNGTKLWQTRRTDRRTKAYLAGDAAQRPSVYAMRKAAEYGDDYEVVTDSHPVLELLSKVNPYQNGFDLAVLRVLYGELTGNAYLHPVIDQRLGIPTELWVMPSQYTEIVPGKEKFIDGYLYGASREQRRFFAEDEVIHFKRPNPADLYYGIGKLEAAWGVAMMNMAAHEMDLGFFENKARPDYLLTIKTAAHPDEIERLEAQIDEKLRGARRTGRFLTATADIDVKPLSFAPKDLAGRDEVVEEIAAIFGVPVSMLKANDPNLASANAGYAMWRETTILPLLRMDEEVMNQKLLPLFGIEEDAFLAYDNPVPSDRVYELQARQAGVAGGWRTANEARAEEGQEPVDDPMADRLLVGGAPLGGPPAPPAPQGVPFGAASVEAVEAPSVEMPQPETKDALSDCVSEKIPTLIEEGYDRDQAVAIAYSMCSEGKSLEAVLSERAPSAETKAISDIDTKPPKTVADNARRALEVRAGKPESERGMTAVGLARARDLANRVSLSEDTIRRMLAYFERHQSDKEGSTWDEQGKGWQAWNGWGGDDGWTWARRKVDEFDRERERKSKSCGCQCRKDSTIAAQVEYKDCGTGSGGFKPGNTCGDEEGSASDAQNRVRQSAKSTAEAVLNRYDIQSDDANAVLEEIDRGLFDDVSVDASSPDDISSMSSSIQKRVASFVDRAKGLIDKMKTTDPESSARIIIDTMVKSQESIGISKLDANTGSVDGDLAFAADAMLSTNLSNSMYANQRSMPVSFQTGGSAQARLDRVNALGSHTGGMIEIDARELPNDPKARSAAIAHELAHANHQATKPDRKLDQLEQAIAERDGMRSYGYSSSFEYVAVFNEMLAQGHKFSTSAWSMYDQFEGPEHRGDFRKSRTK